LEAIGFLRSGVGIVVPELADGAECEMKLTYWGILVFSVVLFIIEVMVEEGKLHVFLKSLKSFWFSKHKDQVLRKVVDSQIEGMDQILTLECGHVVRLVINPIAVLPCEMCQGQVDELKRMSRLVPKK
jgi:hypothetical protein